MDVMMALSLLLQNLTYQLPVLIVLIVTLIMLLSKSEPGKLRNAAAVGVLIILIDRFLSSGMSLLPIVFSYDYRRLSMLMMGLGFALSVLHAVGFGLLAWALVKALPQNTSN